MDAPARRSRPVILTEAAVLLAAIGWGLAIVAVARLEPAAAAEPYAACADKSAGERCHAEYRSAVMEGRCATDGSSTLFCDPRSVRARGLPAARSAPREKEDPGHHAARPASRVSQARPDAVWTARAQRP